MLIISNIACKNLKKIVINHIIDLSVNFYIDSLAFLLNYLKKNYVGSAINKENINSEEYPKLPENHQ